MQPLRLSSKRITTIWMKFKKKVVANIVSREVTQQTTELTNKIC